MSDTGERVGGAVASAVHRQRATGPVWRQDDGGGGSAGPRFIPGQAVELAVQVGSWKEGTPCLIVNQEPSWSPYEWRVTVLRDCGALDASMYEHELRPRQPSRLEKICAQTDHEWLMGWNDWAADAIMRDVDTPVVADGEDPFGAAVDALFEEAINLLLSKHHDYGPRNISQAPGGALNGLAVRLHDKLSRLSHLLQSDGEPNHESLRDTLIDIMCYGSIGVLVVDGSWPE